MDTITLNDKKYGLVPIEKNGKRTIQFIQKVNGIQRMCEVFNTKEDLDKFMKRKGIIVTPMTNCETVMTITWIN